MSSGELSILPSCPVNLEVRIQIEQFVIRNRQLEVRIRSYVNEFNIITMRQTCRFIQGSNVKKTANAVFTTGIELSGTKGYKCYTMGTTFVPKNLAMLS
jgi:hypothetical protein